MNNLLKFLMGKPELKAKLHVDLNDKKEECIIDKVGK